MARGLLRLEALLALRRARDARDVRLLRPALMAFVAIGTIASETRPIGPWRISVEAIHVAELESLPAPAS